MLGLKSVFAVFALLVLSSALYQAGLNFKNTNNKSDEQIFGSELFKEKRISFEAYNKNSNYRNKDDFYKKVLNKEKEPKKEDDFNKRNTLPKNTQTPLFKNLAAQEASEPKEKSVTEYEKIIKTLFYGGDLYIEEDSKEEGDYGYYDTLQYTDAEPDLQKKPKSSDSRFKKEKEFINKVASIIISLQYEKNPSKSNELFNKWFKERGESEAKHINLVADKYLKLSNEISKIEAPESLQYLKDKLSKAYKNAGAKMKHITKSDGDKELMQAVLDYNKSADTVVKSLLSVSDFIAISGIKFEKNEPGSIFVFPVSGSKTFR